MAKPSVYITIPKPCHEAWDQMTPSEKGRFCASCRKEVIDFSSWGDDALYDFFKQPVNVCGRFNNSQLNRSIHIPYQPHSNLYHMVVTMGLVILSAQTADAQTQKKPPLKQQAIPPVKADTIYYARATATKDSLFTVSAERIPLLDPYTSSGLAIIYRDPPKKRRFLDFIFNRKKNQ